MRFRGGGVGHVLTRIDDPDGPEDSAVDVEAETEEVTVPTQTSGGGDGNVENENEREPTQTSGGGDGNVEGEEGRDTDSGSEEGEDNDSEDEEDGEIESEDDGEDDVDGLSAEHIEKRICEVITDDLGFSEL